MYKNQSISRFHLLENSIKITFQIGQCMMPTFTEINKLFFKFLMNTMAPNNQSDSEKQSVVVQLLISKLNIQLW